uniref:Uncharacterized protein n=1 Tax=Cacopsylla melanoneura TaxID=428564 RepID=A0A8D9EZP2_9HEMI
MEHFSRADKKVIRKCDRQAKQMWLTIWAVIVFATLGLVLEPVPPLPQNELDIRATIYGTEHPERRLPLTIKIPFADESESWTYGILYVFEFYILMVYYTIGASTAMSLLPVTLIHVRGQYEILSQYVALIGREHRNSLGQRIFYLNIEKNKFVVIEKEKEDSLGFLTPNQLKRRREKMRVEELRRQKVYEAFYLRQIMRFHQTLLTFQDEVNKYIHIENPL